MPGDARGLVFVLILALLVAGLPFGIACLVQRNARTLGLDTKTIAIGLIEPAWLLLLWAWLGSGPLWPGVVALVLPLGYLAYLRWRSRIA